MVIFFLSLLLANFNSQTSLNIFFFVIGCEFVTAENLGEEPVLRCFFLLAFLSFCP